MRRSPISPRRKKINPDAPQVAAYRCITYTEIRKFDEALADCNVALVHTPNSVYAMTSRGNVYLAKGDLDAALKDYNEALKINPNNIRAHANRGKVFEKRGDLAGARGEYRSASAALTKFDDIDTAIARRFAKERLAALTTAAPAVVRSAQGRPDRRQQRLQERAAARQSGARRQTDRVHASRPRLCDRDAGAGPHPRQVFRGPARVRHASREGRLGGGLLCRSRHGDRRRQLSDPDRRQARRRPRCGDAGGGARAIDRRGFRRAQAAAGDTRCLPRQSVRKEHAADHCAEAGQQGLFQHRAGGRLHGGLCRQARRDRARRRFRQQPVRDRAGA